MTSRHTIIPAVFLVLKSGDGQIFLMRRFNTGYMDGFFSLPAGHLEGKESLKEALIREVKEEIGIFVKPDDLRLVHVSNNLASNPERIDFFFLAEKWVGEPKICEPNKCDQILWVNPKKLPENVVPTVKAAVNGLIQNTAYSEYRG